MGHSLIIKTAYFRDVDILTVMEVQAVETDMMPDAFTAACKEADVWRAEHPKAGMTVTAQGCPHKEPQP